MKRIVRILLAALALSLAGVVALGVHSRINRRPQAVPPASVGESDFLVIPDFRHAQYEGDRLAWELRAEKATFSDMTHAVLDRPVMDLHDPKRGIVTIAFEQGSVDLGGKNLTTRGEATLTTQDGYTVRTRDVTYDGGADRLSTSSGFAVTGTRLRAEGRTLSLQPGARRFEASEEIRVIFYPAGAPREAAG